MMGIVHRSVDLDRPLLLLICCVEKEEKIRYIRSSQLFVTRTFVRGVRGLRRGRAWRASRSKPFCIRTTITR
jgi:hypothetical protein